MSYFLFSAGFIGFIVSLILLVINLFRKRPNKKIGIAIAISILALIIGVVTVPTDGSSADTSRGQAGQEVSEGEALSEAEEGPGETDGKQSSANQNDDHDKNTPVSSVAPSGLIKVNFRANGQGDHTRIKYQCL